MKSLRYFVLIVGLMFSCEKDISEIEEPVSEEDISEMEEPVANVVNPVGNYTLEITKSVNAYGFVNVHTDTTYNIGATFSMSNDSIFTLSIEPYEELRLLSQSETELLFGGMYYELHYNISNDSIHGHYSYIIHLYSSHTRFKGVKNHQ